MAFPRAPRGWGSGPRAGPKSRPARWAAALAGFGPFGPLGPLQPVYQNWRDQLLEDLAESGTAELLDRVGDAALDTLDIELPRDFGRD